MEWRRPVRAAAGDKRGIVSQHPPDDAHVPKRGGCEDVHLRATIEEQADDVALCRDRGEMERRPVTVSGDWTYRSTSGEQPADHATVATIRGVVQRPAVPLPIG